MWGVYIPYRQIVSNLQPGTQVRSKSFSRPLRRATFGQSTSLDMIKCKKIYWANIKNHVKESFLSIHDPMLLLLLQISNVMAALCNCRLMRRDPQIYSLFLTYWCPHTLILTSQLPFVSFSFLE